MSAEDKLADARAELYKAGRVDLTSREHEWLYKMFLECLVTQSKGLRDFNRLPPGMRRAFVELVALYADMPERRCVAFDPARGFIPNKAGAEEARGKR